MGLDPVQRIRRFAVTASVLLSFTVQIPVAYNLSQYFVGVGIECSCCTDLVEHCSGNHSGVLLRVLVIFCESFGQHQAHICTIAQFAALVLNEAFEGGNRIGALCRLNDVSKRSELFRELQE